MAGTGTLPKPQWVGFHEVPGILLVRLMSRCNEKCLFCMVADEIALSDDLDYQEVADDDRARSPRARRSSSSAASRRSTRASWSC